MKAINTIPSTSVCIAHREILSEAATDAQFMDLARRIASHPFCTILLSGGFPVTERQRRYSLAGWDPFLIFTARGNLCTMRTDSGVRSTEGNPLDLLDEIMRGFRPAGDGFVPPFSGGALGYFAYDLKNQIERLPQSAEDECGLPDLWLIWPRQLIIHDRMKGSLTRLVLQYGPQPHPKPVEPSPLTSAAPAIWPSLKFGPLQSNFTRRDT